MNDEKIAVINKRTAYSSSNVLIPRRTWLVVRILLVVLLCLLLLMAGALAAMIVIRLTPPYCDAGLPQSVSELSKPGLFNDLTPQEMISVRDFLLAQDRMGLTPFESATVNSSYIFMMSLHVPFKASVVKYLKGHDRKPKRTVKVIVYRGDSEPPTVDEYLVGSLPKPSYYRLVTNPVYRRSPIPFSSRPIDAVERRQLEEFLVSVTHELETLFVESYGLTYGNCTSSSSSSSSSSTSSSTSSPIKVCILFKDFAPRGIESGERLSWLWAYRPTKGFHLHPLGFAIQIDHKASVPEKWFVTRVIYNGQLFYEIEDLAERYAEGTMRKIKYVMDDVDAEFSTYSKRGHHTYDTPLRGPRLVEPDGHRYFIEDQFVKYFGWSFNFHMRTTTGLQIMDVYFQGEKIAFELSLQEISAFHTGYSPETSWLALYGVSWLLGSSSYELMPGVDCPATATFRDAYHFANSGGPVRHKNSICIFEQTSGMPLRRHFAHDGFGKFQFYGGLASSSLVVRTIISIWSCDYILDYIFHLDGSIELKIALTGYIQASYDLSGQRPYGNRVHEKVRGNLHQNLFHWKIDLDIGDTSNRYQTLNMDTETSASFWYEGVVNKTQLKFTPNLVEDEHRSRVPYDFDSPQHHVIYNMKAENRFGATRGYRIINDHKSKFLLDQSPLSNAATWAKYQMAVTRYKDIEYASSSIYAQGDPFDPIVDFSRFLEDNDTIVDTDIVAWVTSGLYHVPHAEDVPSMSTATNQCRVVIKPYNFFNHCPSMAVSDSIVVSERDDGKGLDYQTHGTDTGEPRCYQKEASVHQFHGDAGETTT